MPEDAEVRDPQSWMADLAARMSDLEREMARLLESLPDDAPEAMLEGRQPFDVNQELRFTLGNALADNVRPTIARLQAASRVTAEQLREEWEQDQARRQANGDEREMD